MKIKHIVGAFVAVLSCALMSISVYAATELTANVSTVANGNAKVNVVLNSTDYDNCASYTVQLKYDKSKYTFVSVANLVETDGYDDEGNPTKVKLGTIQYNPNDYDYGCKLTWSVAENKFENGTCPLFNAFLTPASGVTASAEDFSIVVDELVYIKDEKTTIIQDKLATFVTYEIPMQVDDTWEYGYIHALKAVVKKQGTNEVIAEKSLENYTEEGSNYRFVIKFIPNDGTKHIVDVDLVASTAETADAKEYTEKVVNSISSLAVEALN